MNKCRYIGNTANSRLWSRIWVHHSKNACGDVTVLNIDEEIDRARLFREPKKLALDLTKDLTTDRTTNLGKPVLPSCTISDQKKRHQSRCSVSSQSNDTRGGAQDLVNLLDKEAVLANTRGSIRAACCLSVWFDGQSWCNNLWCCAQCPSGCSLH